MIRTPPRRLIPALAMALMAAACGPDCSGTPAEQVAAVRETFDAFREAMADVDGVTAATFIDGGTLAHYGAIRETALHAPANEVRALPVSDRLFVLSMRHRMTADLLQSLDAAGLFAYSVQQQFIGRDAVEINMLGEIRIADDRTAHGQMLPYGRPSQLEWTFRCEDGRWKLDWSAAMRLGDDEFARMVRQGGQDPDEIVFSILEDVSGERPGDNVWEPLVSR